LACGLPIIASDLPGVRCVFNNYGEGLLVEPGSVEDLKKKLEFIFSHEDERRKMVAAARRRAEEKYDQELMRKKLETLFS